MLLEENAMKRARQGFDLTVSSKQTTAARGMAPTEFVYPGVYHPRWPQQALPLVKPIPERFGPTLQNILNRERSHDIPRASLTMGQRAGIPQRPGLPFLPAAPNFPFGAQMPVPFGGGNMLPKYLPVPPFLVYPKYPPGKKTFRCGQCRYLTDRKNNLKRHIATMHQECGKTLECCDIQFKSKAALRDHVLLFHRAGYKCRFCGRNFCRKALLKRHLAVHNGQKQYLCVDCDYATSHKSNLDRHQKIHEFGPDYCGDDDVSLDEDAEIDVSIDTEEEEAGGMMARDSETCIIDDEKMENEDEDHEEINKASACPTFKFRLADRIRQTHTDSVAPEVCSERLRADQNSDKHTPTTASSPLPGDDVTDADSTSIANCDASPVGPRRLFPTPYKCSECGLCFSSQQLLVLHSGGCKQARVEPQRPVTTLVRPFLDSPSEMKSKESRTKTTSTTNFTIEHLLPETKENPASVPPQVVAPTVPFMTNLHPQHRAFLASLAGHFPLPEEVRERFLPLKKRCLNSPDEIH